MWCARLRFSSSRCICVSVLWFRFCIGESGPHGGDIQIHLGRALSNLEHKASVPFRVVGSYPFQLD